MICSQIARPQEALWMLRLGTVINEWDHMLGIVLGLRWTTCIWAVCSWEVCISNTGYRPILLAVSDAKSLKRRFDYLTARVVDGLEANLWERLQPPFCCFDFPLDIYLAACNEGVNQSKGARALTQEKRTYELCCLLTLLQTLDTSYECCGQRDSIREVLCQWWPWAWW